MGNRANVISVCGAGGKTTKCIELAVGYAKKNKSVVITTTTNMQKKLIISNFDRNLFYKSLNPISARIAIKNIKKGKIFFVGEIENNDKIKSISENDYRKLCNIFDVIIVETDGSKWMPLKIPRIEEKKGFNNKNEFVFYEPIIPENTSKIIVVYGKQSIGRKLKTVCHRFDELKYKLRNINMKLNGDTIVTEKIIRSMANAFYIKPIKQNFNVPIELYLSELNKIKKNYKKISFVLCGAGLSNRYGKNKLLETIDGKKLYEIELAKIEIAKKNLIKKIKKDFKKKIDIDAIFVLNEKQIEDNLRKKYKDVKIVLNDSQEKGLSHSIKLGVTYNKNVDAICFFNMDMPSLTSKSIKNMILNFLCSDREIAAMHDTESIKNPAIFSKKYFREILKLSGDRGCKEIINKNLYDLYVYHIDKEETIDIDTKSDMQKYSTLNTSVIKMIK